MPTYLPPSCRRSEEGKNGHDRGFGGENLKSAENAGITLQNELRFRAMIEG